jgi:hypothetical protein
MNTAVTDLDFLVLCKASLVNRQSISTMDLHPQVSAEIDLRVASLPFMS